MNARSVVAAAVGVALLPVGAATAKPREPRVTVSADVHTIPLDAGYLVEVVCVARADAAAPAQVPVVTAVSCAVDGFVESRAVPGGVAVAGVTSAVTGPFELCVSGEAVFVDPVAGTSPTAEREPRCRTVRP